MALDIQELLREVAANAIGGGGGGSNGGDDKSNGAAKGGLSGVKGVAAGAGAAALIPFALKNAGKLAKGLGVDGLENVVKSPGDALGGAASNVGERLMSNAKDKAKDTLDEAGGPGGVMKDAAKQMLPFGGGDGGGGGGGAEGVGKGRRMPVQQSVDIGLPIETVYNQWTQFEDWPQFMHRVTRVTQEDDCTVSFATKIWGKTKEFTAKIETQRPEEKIKWKVSQGMTHNGVVSFHELGPNLTRVMLSFDVDPGSLVEKFARGARHVKRAARADLHRFKAFIEMAEQETGAWRGVIEDGELVEEHDPSYDEQREYSDVEELTGQDESDEDEEGEQADEGDENEDESDDEEESPKARRPQRGSQSRRRGQDSASSGTQSRSRTSKRQSKNGSSPSSSGGSSRSSSGGRSRASSSGQSRSRSTKRQSKNGSSGSGSGGRSSSGARSRGSSSGQSRSRGGRSQSRKS
jgi:uncharacterized membrane protein